MDAIIVFNGFSDTVLIDSVSIDIDLPVGTSSPESIVYTGSAGLVQVGASFEVRCAENFTGWDCLTACSDFRNCSECGLPGFTGEFCQFSVENCKGVWCNGNNSQCIRARNGSYVCACETGFTGESCETLIDYCAGVTCSESGFCENTFPGYMCVCEQDYTGPMCEVEINECESVTCTGNGRCMEGQDSFVCECDPGFAGVLCERKGELVYSSWRTTFLHVNAGSHDMHKRLCFKPLNAHFSVLYVSSLTATNKNQLAI